MTGIFDNPFEDTTSSTVAQQDIPVEAPRADRFVDEAEAIASGEVEKPDTFWKKLEDVMQEAQRTGTDEWSAAHHKRFSKGQANRVGLKFEGKDDDTLRDVEHFLYARDTANLGPMGFLQMAIGTPGHAAAKVLGLKKGDTSAEELLRGFQGATVGFSEYLRDKFKR